MAAAKEKPACNDGLDNDRDGKIDLQDLGCSNRNDNDESNCGDGVCSGTETQSSCFSDCKPADSCSDSDGGIITAIFGTTSGFNAGFAYSHSDSCLDASNVVENYCSVSQSASQQQSCGADSSIDVCSNGSVFTQLVDNFCGSGKCQQSTSTTPKQSCSFGCTNGVCNPPQDSCTDTDGGNTPNTYGAVSGYLNGSTYSNADYCVDSGNLLEYFCNGNYRAIQQQACAYGCTNGACNPAPADTCADTDGGVVLTINGTTYGYLSGNFYSYTDTCGTNTIVLENYCGGSGGNYRSQTAYSCGNSTNATTCINGACV